MILVGTFLKVSDRTGVILVQCIKIFGTLHKKTARIGDIVLVSVKRLDPKKFVSKKKKKKKYLFSKGTIHRGLIIRTKVNYLRTNGIFIKFNENSLILVSKKNVPLSNRIYGPVLKELCMRWPSLGCISLLII